MNMPNQPTKTLQSTAERMRLYRHRRRRGRRIVQVEIDAREVEVLVRRGYLEPKDREDRSAIEAAANAAISDLLGGFL
jgi:hypothetical protein